MGEPARKKKTQGRELSPYTRILGIDGTHPLKERVPFGYVEYPVRRRKGGKVRFFNFPLAKEMGLVAADHAERLNSALAEVLLETFGLVIVNEYDFIHGTRIPAGELKPHPYMATRYLQLQHPSRTGLTSGDGRSIWNGVVRHRGRTWDLTSRGTGATCLSPATAINQKFYKTGDPGVSYGCGLAALEEGVGDVVFSEIFTRNGIATERILLVLEFPGGYSVTVRAGLNLLRPSHFFLHLKQGQYARLKAVADYYIDRQVGNGVWAKPSPRANRYDVLLAQVGETFARMAARFEAEYVFCWLDWDGDNILADGGIIDFGSIRQFGLYHHEYRFDDDARWSTNVKEQRRKARYIVQTFAQIVDYLKTGRRRPIGLFRHAPVLRRFDQIFAATKRELLLRRMGFAAADQERLLAANPRSLAAFERVFYALEKVKSRRGQIKVADGISWNAVFCMRDVLRELPALYLGELQPIAAKAFMDIMRSSFATGRDGRLTRGRRAQIATFQSSYLQLVKTVARLREVEPSTVLAEVARRSAVINRFERITGDAMTHLAEDLVKGRGKLTDAQFHRLVQAFVAQQVLDPDGGRSPAPNLGEREKRLAARMADVVRLYREGL